MDLAAEGRARLPFTARAAYTGSMRPLLGGGELLLVSARPWAELRVGDLVVGDTVYGARFLVCHRIVAGDPFVGFVTKGDSSPLADPVRLLPWNYVGVWSVLLRPGA